MREREREGEGRLRKGKDVAWSMDSRDGGRGGWARPTRELWKTPVVATSAAALGVAARVTGGVARRRRRRLRAASSGGPGRRIGRHPSGLGDHTLHGQCGWGKPRTGPRGGALPPHTPSPRGSAGPPVAGAASGTGEQLSHPQPTVGALPPHWWEREMCHQESPRGHTPPPPQGSAVGRIEDAYLPTSGRLRAKDQ